VATRLKPYEADNHAALVMKSLLRTLGALPRLSLIFLVKAYRLLLSPWLGSSCRFTPTCSVYALDALEQRGAVQGSYLTLKRLARCQPWCPGGHDPVPPVKPRSANFTSYSFLSSLFLPKKKLP
jgi:uncharacterized protein